jgi:endonuclease/exonuclease/phosphatase family metal-dependent hydrolase
MLFYNQITLTPEELKSRGILDAPQALRNLRPRCIPAGARHATGGRSLPCDVAATLARDSRDFAALARYAAALDADVVALQEVDGVSAAALVFPGYRFCFSSRTALQNNGFAVRDGIPFRCGPEYRSLDLGNRVRRGVEIVVYPGDPREMVLLSVHLKSGCSDRPLATGNEACRLLASQVRPLEQWIESQARAGYRFAVLGDFNRSFSLSAPDELWNALDTPASANAGLVDVTAGMPFINCGPHQAFRSYIDHIVLGRRLAARLVPGSFTRITYSLRDAVTRRLSDHCPVAVRLRLDSGSGAGD